jgi:hypothetical protein
LRAIYFMSLLVILLTILSLAIFMGLVSRPKPRNPRSETLDFQLINENEPGSDPAPRPEPAHIRIFKKLLRFAYQLKSRK